MTTTPAAVGRVFDLGGRVAAVIGAAAGIGDAVARGCARQGALVHCLDLDAAGAQATAERIGAAGGEATAAALDVRDGAAVDAALAALADRRGRLDVVVTTPGINVRKPILDYADDEFDRVVGLNLKGSFHVIRAAGLVMRAHRRGSIILFSSIRAQVVEPGQSVYAATKAGIVQLVRTAAAELGPFGVRVNAVAPGSSRRLSPPPSATTRPGTPPTPTRACSAAGRARRKWSVLPSSWPRTPRAT